VDIAATRLGHQVRQQELVLAGLLGREPRRLVEEGLARGADLAALRSPPAIPAGLPADLLHRRPDLRQAEQRLLATQARMEEVRAALFPDLSLTAYLGSESKALTDLFSGSAGIWGLTASLVQSVFNAGRTEAAVQAAAARQEQAVAEYEQTVRAAFREVLDALVAHREARERGEGEARRAESLRRAAELAELRHENGLTGYLEVLDARRNLFQAESNGIEARRTQLAATADLALALGGGWQSANE
jgi:multidrug efflux system outer membrane protein